MRSSSACRNDAAPVNLRQRALAAAHRLLEARGVAGLNLRSLAAELGTGGASLYYHFDSKDALLAEVAIDGFRALKANIAAALSAPAGKTPFHAASEEYLRFTRRRPALYALMYSERLLTGFATVRAAEREAFEAFQRAIGPFGVPTGNVENVALMFWALGRGIASLSLTGDDPGAAKRISRRVVDGLGALLGEPIKDRGLAPRAA